MTIRLQIVICSFLLTLGCLSLRAQNVMQIETGGNPVSIKFYEGDELFVKMRQEKMWRKTSILVIDVKNNIVEFDFGTEQVSEIRKIKTISQKKRGKAIRNKMLLLSGSILVYSPLDPILKRDWNKNMLTFAGINVAAAMLIRPIIDLISTHNIGSRKRLRLLNISFRVDEE